ncbi:MAG: glycosyltransferase family 4 protein [Saprospiraceae bacterium]|nr:glycosyltransferase family 4 protein [Saprospiraceae bacterium]
MKKVLIITYYWPPAGGGGVQRWVKFVKYLRDFGWEPIVFTVKDGSYPIIDATLQNEVPDGVEVIKSPIFEPYDWYKRLLGKSGKEKVDANFLSEGKKMNWKDKLAVWIRGNFFIPDARAFWVRPSKKLLDKYLFENQIDAVVSSGPPHSCHLIALGVKNKYNLPWIVDYRDPWTQIDYFNDLGLTAWARKKHEHLEKMVLDRCNIIITVGKTMAEDLLSITENRKEVITNGYDETDRPSSDTNLDDGFTVTYIGTMNDARNPSVLWEALSQLKNENHPLIQKISVNLVGKPEQIIHSSIEKYGISNLVKFCGYVTHQEAINYQNASRVLLLIINKTSNNKSILTGKIFEYLASGRPILCIGPNDGDAAAILKDAQSGFIYDYEDVGGIKKYLIDAFNLYAKNESVARSTNIEKYSRKYLTEKLVGLLNEISQK